MMINELFGALALLRGCAEIILMEVIICTKMNQKTNSTVIINTVNYVFATLVNPTVILIAENVKDMNEHLTILLTCGKDNVIFMGNAKKTLRTKYVSIEFRLIELRGKVYRAMINCDRYSISELSTLLYELVDSYVELVRLKNFQDTHAAISPSVHKTQLQTDGAK